MSNITNVFRPLKFPHFCKDKEFKHLMTLMLGKNPVSRLYKLQKIKQHSYFQYFNWENLISMTLEVPHVPKLSKDDLTKSLPYLNHMKTVKEWVPSKETNVIHQVDEKIAKEYEKWYQEF